MDNLQVTSKGVVVLYDDHPMTIRLRDELYAAEREVRRLKNLHKYTWSRLEDMRVHNNELMYKIMELKETRKEKS